jgi:hypothetical protein
MSSSPAGDAAAPDPATMRAAAREVLESHWREPGFTCPNAATYPWLWLWDSCFHAIVWAELGEADRALSELRTALVPAAPDGFVPHLRYLDGSSAHEGFWGRAATSSITQPPVYGLAIAELQRRGTEVPGELVQAAVDGVRFLVERRRRSPGGLVEIVHPWESGCDHSPRWDDLMAPLASRPAGTELDPYDAQRWFDRKGELLAGVHRSADGSPLWNDEFAVGSVAFTALVAHNAACLGELAGDRVLAEQAVELAEALAERWEPERRTWVDDGPTAHGSGRVRTAEALLGLLVDRRSAALDSVVAELEDDEAFGGPFGPAQVHRGEPTHRRHSYWRGPSWPQLDHLLWMALREAGAAGPAARLAGSTRRGAWSSGWAEYWDPDDARAGGAAPQSWTTLAITMVGGTA